MPFVLLALFLGAAPVAEREDRDPLGERWRWRIFYTANGLPSNAVLCFHETRDGELLAGLDRGVCRYDGYVWRTIPSEGGPMGRILRIVASRAGRLYAAGQRTIWCREGGGAFRKIHEGEDIHIAASPASGAVYFFDRGRLYLFDSAGHALPYEASPSFGERDVNDLAITEDGTFWAATDVGLRRLEAGGDGWGVPEGLEATGFAKAPAHRIYRVPGPALWAAVGEPGEPRPLVRLDESGWHGPEPDSPQRLVVALVATPEGEVYASTMDGGLFHRCAGRWRFRSRIGPGAVVVTAALRDSRGAIWFSLSGLGVARYDPLSRRWRSYRAGLGLPANRILSLIEARDGSVWAGTQTGLYRYHEGRVEVFREASGIRLTHITGLAEDRHGGIWISSGASFEGALQYREGVWTRFSGDKGLVTYRVHRITRDRQGNLWFGTLGPRPGEGREMGAWMYDGYRFRPFGPGDGLIDGRVYDVYQAADGSYWFATWGGLSHLSRLEGGAWESFTTREGLANDRIFAVGEGPDGSIWVAYQVNGCGVSRYRKGRWTHYTAEDGLINENVWSIATTPDGDVWFGTEGGIARFDGFTFYSYTVAEAPFFSNVWPITPARDGSVLVGTLSNGIFRFRRDDVDPPRLFPPADLPQELELPFTLRWEGRDYGDGTRPDRLLYRTCTDGGPWSSLRPGNRLALRNLRPGAHRVEIQGRDRDGNAAQAPLVLPLRVRAGFWRRPESIAALAALAVAALLAALWGLGRYREERGIRKRYRTALEETSSAVVYIDAEGEVIEAIGSDPARLPPAGEKLAVEESRALAALLEGVPADGIRIPAGGGDGWSWLARGAPLPEGGAMLFLRREEEIGRDAWDRRVERLRALVALARQALDRAPGGGEEGLRGAIAALARLEEGGAGPPRAVAPLELLDRLARAVARECPSVRIHLPDPLGLWNLWGGPRDLAVLIGEILRNAAEATGSGRVTVRARNRSLTGGGGADLFLQLTVEDAGPGMDGITRARAFEPFFSTKAGRTGLGLCRAVAAAARLGGAVEVDPGPSAGTRIRILVPASREPAASLRDECEAAEA